VKPSPDDPIRHYLEECEQERRGLEIKYGLKYADFQQKLKAGELGDEFRYDLETDALKWNDLIAEKEYWLQQLNLLVEEYAMNSDAYKAEDVMISIIPDAEIRKRCLQVFLESLIEANKYGSNKWGAYYTNDRVRLLVGNLIVLTIHTQGVWVTLDQQRLEESQEQRHLLELSQDWRWDKGKYSEYVLVPSKNGYYVPSKNLQLWLMLKELHFAFIGRVAQKFKQLRKTSQSVHMSGLLAYLRHELKQYVPEPVYEYSADLISPSNPIQEVKEYQPTYQDLPETEREAIVQSRIGQGRFRTELIKHWRGCAVTDCQARKVLRASHIKPWRNSSNEERLDVYNGLLLIPNLDAAFDNGMISFADDGKIIISDLLTEYDKLKLGIHPDMRIAKLDERHLKYLKYHRRNIFKRAR